MHFVSHLLRKIDFYVVKKKEKKEKITYIRVSCYWSYDGNIYILAMEKPVTWFILFEDC